MENLTDKPRSKRTTEQIKLLLLRAVGEIIKTKGYQGLNVGKITKQATVARHSISLYFGTTEKLVEQYHHTQDKSADYAQFLQEPDDFRQVERLRYLLKSALEKEYRHLLDNPNSHFIWPSENCVSELTSSMGSLKSKESDFTFMSAEHFFRNKSIDFLSLRLILESSVKFLALKSELKNSEFCGIDTASSLGRQQIVRTLMQIIDLVFDQKLKK